MSPELPDLHAVKRRRRPAKSCDACRARKVRCDQRMPCGPCRKARSAPKCIYGPDAVRLPSPDPSPEESGRGGAASSTPRTAPRQQSPPPEGLPLNGAAETNHLREQVARLQDRIDSLESRLDASAERPAVTPATDLCVVPIQPKLRQTADKNKLFGANHWIHTAKHMNAGNVGAKDVELTFETPKIDFAKIRQDVTKLRLTIKQFEMPILSDPVPDILATIPTRAECDALVDIYLSTHERMYRVLHVPTFRQEYDAFWQNQAASSMAFRMKLILILALGSTLSDDAGECALADRQTRTWTYAAQWWLTGPTEKSTFNLEGMQVACLLQLARQMTAVGRAWISSGSLTQMAFSIGLHRDPSHFPAMAPRQAHLQRQLWATVQELTLLSAMDGPMQAYADLASCDTRPPDNVDDEQLAAADDAGHAPPPSAQGDDRITDASLQRLLCSSFPRRLQAARNLHGGHKLAYADTIRLANELKADCARLSRFFDAHSASPLITTFHRSFLDIHYRLHILRLHRQFLLQQPDEVSCLLSRKSCFDAAMVIASYASHCSSSSSSYPTSGDPHLCRLEQLFLNTTGSMRAPLSLEIVTMLGLELRMRLAEDDSGGRGPAARLAREAREPIFAALETIRDKFLRRIETGSPRCKAFGLTSFVVAQLRAVERRESPAQALSNAVTEKLADVQLYLEATVERLAASGAGGDAGMEDFDLDALLAMDFGGSDGGFNFGGFGMGDSMW
ncbi:C6 transcription factor [Cordyceps javanica]|uniref:C6 transcription factor n=1 Tax=Cordyceps javanica TaxID=43265 RepID=A0A545UMS9_9HYPO|nr:C6 transcription factor [Cordyceps javanica]TQW02417.1 C6 transcription factor [Cordyceps javanica]